MRSKLVCLCNMVTEDEIRMAVKNGAVTIRDVQNITRAAATCGRCGQDVHRIVKENNPGSEGGARLKPGF